MSKAFIKTYNRSVPMAFWSTDLVIKDHTPESQYFMLYLLTTASSKPAGIYYLNLKYAKEDLGYSLKTVNQLIDRFSKNHVILWSPETQELAILDYLKYAIVQGGEPFMNQVKTALRSIQNEKLIISVYKRMSDWWDASPRAVDHDVKATFEEELRRREVPREDYDNGYGNNNGYGESRNRDSAAQSADTRLNLTPRKDDTVRNSQNRGAQCADNAQAKMRNEDSKNAQESAQCAKQKLSVAQIEEEFEGLWAKYPNKKDKKRAFSHYKAWRKASPTKHTPEYLYKRLELYKEDLKYSAQHGFKRNILNGSTWFNGRFDDELEIERVNKANTKPHGGFDPNMLTENNDLGVNDDDLPF